MPAKKNTAKPRRAVIVGGVRTPFIRAFGPFTQLDTIALGTACVKGLLNQFPVEWKELDSLVWGGTILPGGIAVNIGREIIFDAGLPDTLESYTVTRACTTSMLSTTLAAASIERGDADVIIAGGSDSTSNVEVRMPPTLVHKAAPVVMSAKSTPVDYLKLLTKIHPKNDIVPSRPSIRERTTGELMGESAEKMAGMHGISREDQDAFAVQSHTRAAKALAAGRFSKEIVPVETPGGETVYADNILRGDTSVDKMARLKPAFKEDGTLTAGNSSALTDGASAVLMMSEEKAKALGFTPLAAVTSWSYDAVDPNDQLLIGPAISMPKAAAKAGMTADDIDIFDIHEAFAAQVLCVIKMLGNDEFCQQRLGLDKAFKKLDPQDINLLGGSLAFGHPFAATGTRMISTMANELHESGKQSALLGICAGGALSGAMVLEAV
ncbi:acetyl-CoA acyltransferase [Desulfatibacillum alkenivorans DSM 16219]|jgi:acetyl-CoA acyltransferase|uniref:Acetyl-CoA acyltransferase n=1 Tax=Desulfatibacillum alkenivorans DSM 16219 TaxID=1121393 RepID=A0A1M6P040_9BACT|nr:acetyl-CoA C-acyltransferase [Desulfatibacillum alkenivorans]SHK01359.1 acetyl-CoA acyltransferase [Desulfatibacillum alkenivorans DSM 16219]